MHTCTLNVTTSGRQTISVSKDAGTKRVSVNGFDPEMRYSAEDAKELAALFAGVEKLLTD
jgi:hypothetical protein